ncbi:hypothetical protein [uncultured Flavobacterium sp.]|uniref:hypothetical protein n=1 Tax=uncultured Flavobacterium sp. TaxID=165435 RepID=UPI0025E5D4D7|nr:hypothetical protein [uncultured Flavobacterium sp.]
MNQAPDKGNTLAIISYLTIIGTIISMVQNSEARSQFASFHIRQALGLMLTFFALGYPIGYFDNWTVTGAFYIFFFILWAFGFVSAVQGQYGLIPVVGGFFQKAFKNL